MPSTSSTSSETGLGQESAVPDSSPDDRSVPSPLEGRGSRIVHVEGLSKTFGQGDEAVTAVDDVTFSVTRGEIVGLLGPNGAGKTTIIKSLLGLVTPDEGTVEIAGLDVYDTPKVAYEHVEAMMEGARNQYWRLTVRENLEYFAAISGEHPGKIRERHTQLLEALDLREFENEQVRNLSRGMKQKVSIASTLARDVDVVFLDEPTLGLDVQSSITFRQSLRDIAEDRDLTILLSSHDMDVIESICDRVVIIDDGEVIADNRVEELLQMFETQDYRITVRNVDPSSIRQCDLSDNFDSVTDLDDKVQIEVTADSDTFYTLMAELSALGARLVTVESMAPDLAEAFVRITGEGNR